MPALLLEVRRTLRPGDPGTRKLLDRFGDQLVCVRYRYDADTDFRVTTVELVVDTGFVAPRRPQRPRPKAANPHEPVHLRIGYDELDLRLRVREVGGRWLRDRKVWEISCGDAERLGLMDRIVVWAETS
jgi:hypothetical protein